VLLTIPLGPWSLTAYQPGLERFLSIAFKSWISVQAAIVLATSTPFPDLLVAMRAVRIPRLLVAIFALMWRYLFVLADETLRMVRARASRSGHSDQPGLKPGGSLVWRARVTGGWRAACSCAPSSAATDLYGYAISRLRRRGTHGLAAKMATPGLLVLGLGLAILAILLGLAYLF